MRLSDILSRPLTAEFKQVEGFLKKNIGFGKHRKITVGKVLMNFFCKQCDDLRTFSSGNDLSCVGISDHLISIDCVLKCSGDCNLSVMVWFLVDCQNSIYSQTPNVRILTRREKLSEMILRSKGQYDDFSDLLERAERAYYDDLGAGAIVYLRKILEQVTTQVATAANINIKRSNNARRPFKDLLDDVDKKCSVIPKEFSENGYKLFKELSSVIHGDYDEQLGLKKYKSFYRLVIGILDNVKNNRELMSTIDSLGWNDKGIIK